MPRRYVMAISCICHYRPAHKLVTAHLECRASLRTFCALFVFSLCPPSPPSFLPHSSSCPINHLSYLFASLPFIYYSFGHSLFVLFCAKWLPPSRLHSGGEASIVIVPHQRRFAINLSPCRGESERCSPRADHTRNTGCAINLCPLAIV